MSKVTHRKTILIVDNDENIRIMSDDELSDRSFTVRSGKSGFESLRFLKKNPKVDLLILDIKMDTPDSLSFTGKTAIQKLNIPVLFYLGKYIDQYYFPSWLAGVWWESSSDLEELKKKVKEFLNCEERLLRGWSDFKPA
jgi:DNA-binding response OmpR family regulator